MKILCVCGLGQGTSLILRMNVETVLQTMGVTADVEHTDVSTASSMSADYIVTNSELAQSLQAHDATIILVENYFDNAEIQQALEKHIQA
ncbi:PTS sugar transporter subunit IIB [Camelliibacillus cellulosilyticus]|uniref:PTS sugar transporter subunit IIB n=1 Tax=Camelliibacillus cellulosilyticus TaxID=2174486 RepID=A0ABV9GQ66_9BACL